MLPFHEVRPRALCMRLLQALSLSVALGTATTILAASPSSGADAGTHAFHISAGSLAEALHQFIAQSGLQVLYGSALVEGHATARIDTTSTSRAVLDTLLRNTGLTYEFTDSGTVVIKRTPSVAKPQSTQAQKRSVVEKAAPPTTLESVTVTGTRIRGGVTASPTITIGAQQVQDEGFSDLGEVIRSIPQNFSGGQNPGALSGNLAGAGNANQNVTGGSGLDLRGLGPDATLTLLDGRRMAYDGFSQAVDISAIPVAAVDRIDIVPDGASAIYGSDAVGGVGNVILKRNFQGVTVGARYGGATDGGLTTHEYDITAGTIWNSGGLIATYENQSADPIYSNQRSYTTQLLNPAPQYAPSTLYPGSNLHSGLLSVHQSLGDFAELRLDALRTTRDQLFLYNYSSSHINSRVTPNTAMTLVSPSLEIWLPDDWSLLLSATSGWDEHHEHMVQTVIASGAATLTDLCYCNESRSYELGTEGSLFALPGGDARLAAGIGYRENTFREVNYINSAGSFRGSEGVRFAYAELNLPLISPDQQIRGMQRLDVTAAVRREDYSTFGGVTTPKLGVVYGPNSDFTLKASWGKSFKAPTLLERYYAQTAYLFSPVSFGGVGYPADATALDLDGGNKNLQPERATTQSVSLAFHPEAVRELEMELSWFRIDYRDRVIQPITNGSQALSNPIYAPFVDFAPTLQAQEDVIANAQTFYNYAGAPYDPDKVAAIIYTQYANTAQQRIQGIDLSGSYLVELGEGTLTLRGSTSWLESTQQTLSNGSAYALAGTLFNPPKVSGRLGGDWKQGGFTASLFANYRGGVTNLIDGVKSASFTTFDATLRYATGKRDDAWSGLEFALSLDNVLNRDPPLYRVAQPLYVAPYDSTNYSAVGRFLSLSVSKHF